MADGTTLSRRSRAIRRRWLPALLLCIVVQAIFPVQAYAWFGWLDDLSGPGPFWGGEFQVRLLCLMDQPSSIEAIAQTRAALLQIPAALPQVQATAGPIPFDPERAQNTVKIQNTLNMINADILAMASYPRERKVLVARLLTEMGELQDAINRLPPAGTLAPVSPLQSLNDLELTRAMDLLRESQVAHVSTFPGGLLWADCHDGPSADRLKGTFTRRQDRHPVLSLGIDYREYTNWDLKDWGHVPENDPFAKGQTIHLRVIEPQLSWPLSGRFDVLDGVTGMGLYSFSSKGLSGTRVGLIVEPIRLDLHFPARLLDKKRHWYTRLALALSVRSGLVMFPAGFAPDAFNAKGEARRRISGGEALFENGIVLNVGRIFGW